jgi:hypothetical protein
MARGTAAELMRRSVDGSIDPEAFPGAIPRSSVSIRAIMLLATGVWVVAMTLAAAGCVERPAPAVVIARPLTDVAASFRPLPSMKGWTAASGRIVEATDDRLVFEGDGSAIRYQLVSPMFPVDAGSKVLLRLRVERESGACGMGVLGADSVTFVVGPPTWRITDNGEHEYCFTTGPNARVALAFVNANPRAGCEPTRLIVHRGKVRTER